MLMEKLSAGDKAEILIEALPYIKKFSGKTFVIKYGGNAMTDDLLKEQVINDIILMKYVGINPVIVHGGGPDINKWLDRAGIESNFVQGLRITDQKVMEVVQMVLVGKVNKEVVALFENNGSKAVGLNGVDGWTLKAEKIFLDVGGQEKDLGFVGRVSQVNPALINQAINDHYIPVIAPVAMDERGQSYNINADYAAGSIAASLKAEKFFLLTDIDGVLDKEGKLISRMHTEKAENLIKDGTISGGMIPKIQCCMEAVGQGVPSAHIVNGTLLHALLLEIFTDKGVGTMFINKEEK